MPVNIPTPNVAAVAAVESGLHRADVAARSKLENVLVPPAPARVESFPAARNRLNSYTPLPLQSYRSAVDFETGSRGRGQNVSAAIERVRIMVIGAAGPHATRTYLPHIAHLKVAGIDVRACVGIDIEVGREAVLGRMAKLGDSRPEEFVFIDPISPCSMDARTEIQLNRLVRKYRINVVIVATPPEAHLQYVLWAFRNQISVILDKPLTSRVDAVSNLRVAGAIKEDAEEMIAALNEAQKHARICGVVNAQRRWHPAFDYLRAKIEEVRELTGHPVSHISAAHGDGQFRLPREWVELSYHGYNLGMGKGSHSGYHEIDMSFQLLAAGWTSDTRPQIARVQSSVVQPGALLRHMPRERFEALFGSEYTNAAPYTDEELMQIASRLGEVDTSITIELVRDGLVEGIAGIDLQHNTVSARSWLEPSTNLYKENGRMKREFWRIDCGPFQSIRLETIQAEDKHDGPGAKGHSLGKPNHLQIVTVRNEQLLGAGPRIEIVNGAELGDFDATRLQSEQVKMAALREMIDFVQGRISEADLRSDLHDHLIPASVLSAAYVSHVHRQNGRGSSWVSVEL